jgi:hypothetical protein
MNPAEQTQEKRPAAPARPSSFNYRELIVRVVLVLLVFGSLTMVWWSIQRLKPRQKAVAELNVTVNKLSGEVDQMETRWSKQEVEQILRKNSQVGDVLFVGQPALESWLANLREQVVPMALDLKADFGQAAADPAASNKVFTVPATVSVDVKPAPGIDAIRTPYERVLRLSQRLAGQAKRADLVEMSVVGGSNSISRAVVVLNLWAGEETQ